MKCFFLDIDGTILPFGKPIPGSAIEAVEYARRNGNKVFVATGRAKAEFPSLDPIVFDGYVYSAGAAVSIDGKLILDLHVSGSDHEELSSYFGKRGLLPMFQTDVGTFMEEETYDLFQYYSMKFIGRPIELGGLVRKKMPESLLPRKYLYLASEGGFKANDVQRELPDSFKYVPNTLGFPQSLAGEVQMASVTKASGIRAVLSYLGMDISDAVAIGDGSNDIEMVMDAGCGIAMGNASDDLKAVSDYIAKDIEDDGLKDAIMHALGE